MARSSRAGAIWGERPVIRRRTRCPVEVGIALPRCVTFGRSTGDTGDFVVLQQEKPKGEYHWHKHDNDDEFFFVLSGTFIIDLEGRSVALSPRQGFVVPKGVIHRTRSPEKAVVLMVETATIVPTGDA